MGIFAAVGSVIIFVSTLVSSLGTQKVASALPRPTETFKCRELLSELRQVSESTRNTNFTALFLFGLFSGIGDGLGSALYVYIMTYFFKFTGRDIGTIANAVMIAPAIGYWAAPRSGKVFGK